MQLGIPAFIGAYFAVDMSIGAVILGIWQYVDPAEALLFAPIVASALIAGDGVWTVPSAILALAKVCNDCHLILLPYGAHYISVHVMSSCTVLACSAVLCALPLDSTSGVKILS